jgi:antitoxin component YwqK of YwqJK toxin-antitoxin module
MWENIDEYGNIISLGNYNKDARNGKWQFFYRNGKIEQEGNYVSGKEHGLWKWYFLNGQERKIENYHYGSLEGNYQENDSLGNVTVKGFFAENQEEGEWEVRLGNVIWKGIYNFGDLNGMVESFYQNGNRYFEGSFVSGFQEGRHKYYYENGELREEEIWDMGERIGTWRKYDFLGNQIISITYRNGEEYLINGVKVRY